MRLTWNPFKARKCFIMRHWIFDFDGTLFNTEPYFIECLSYALEPFDMKASWEFLERVRSEHPNKIFDKDLGLEKAPIAMARLIEAGKRMSEKVQPYPGIFEMLKELKSSTDNIHIWTGRDEPSTLRILERTGMASFFTKIVTGTCVPKNKPAPDGLHLLSTDLKAGFDQFVMVGDHHHDIVPAKELGCTTVHARWKEKPNSLESEPHQSFDSVDDFVSWLRSL